MKRRSIAAIAMMALMLATGAVQARIPGGPAGRPGPNLERLATDLKLTEAQQTQIRAIQEAERAKAQPLMDALKEKRDQLRRAGDGTTFDEAAVKALATAIVQQEAELLVARVKSRTQINALLTAEQRELLKTLRPEHDRRPPPPEDDGE